MPPSRIRMHPCASIRFICAYKYQYSKHIVAEKVTNKRDVEHPKKRVVFYTAESSRIKPNRANRITTSKMNTTCKNNKSCTIWFFNCCVVMLCILLPVWFSSRVRGSSHERRLCIIYQSGVITTFSIWAVYSGCKGEKYYIKRTKRQFDRQ